MQEKSSEVSVDFAGIISDFNLLIVKKFSKLKFVQI